MLRLDSFAPDDDEGASRWRQLQSESDVTSPFASLEVVSAIGRAQGKMVELHLASVDGSDKAAIATFESKLGPFRRRSHPALAYYSPVLLRNQPRDAAVHAGTDCLSILLDNLAKKKHFPRLQLPPGVTDVRPAHAFGYTSNVYYTYLIDLDSAGIDTWSSSTRRMYRKNVDDFVLEEGTADPALVLRLAAQAYLRNDRRPPFRTDRLAEEVNRLRESERARVFFIRRKSGAVTGGLVILIAGRHACYWIAGSEPGPSMTVLVGRALEELQKSGVEIFDFLGANTPSIAEFKRRFGPALAPFYHCSRNRRIG